MKPLTIALLVILLVLIAAMVVLYFLGKKAQKRKDEQDEQIKAAAQTVSMLTIADERFGTSGKCSGTDTEVLTPFEASDR